MTNTIDRRTALGLAAAAVAPLAAAPTPAAAKAANRAPGKLYAAEPPLSAMISKTLYFEIDSVLAGAKYAVWVSLPGTYELEPTKKFPLVYIPDGNFAAAECGASHEIVTLYDPINPITPFVQVSVGYVGKDADRNLAVRARDLLPPNEALPEGIDAGIRAMAGTGMLDQEGAELYVHNLHNPAADKFLAFLQDELHPLIAAQFRVETETAGLWGYSYGGLFATYVALSRSHLFHKIGAGSPGILSRRSRIFEMYAAEVKAGADHSGRMLHMTVNERELTVPTAYVLQVGAGTAQFMELSTMQPLKGLKFSSRIVEFESHISGTLPSWYSFLRTCYGAA